MKLVRKPPQIPFIRKLCAHLSDKEIEEAEVRFLRYVAICEQIAQAEFEEKREANFDKSKEQS